MKIFLLMFISISISLSHTIYVSQNLSRAKIGGFDYSIEPSARIGYSLDLWKNSKKNISISLGIDLPISPIKKPRISFTSYKIDLKSFFIYLAPKYSISNDADLWVSLGFGFSESKEIDTNNTVLMDGPVYGLGMIYYLNNKWSLSVCKYIENYSIDKAELYMAHAIVNKTNFDIKRHSLILGYSF